ncbi:MAG: lipoyl synthase [bacterium]|nr:lipoyl synthase [bacterium]
MRYKLKQFSDWKRPERHPEWLKVKMPHGERFHELKALVKTHNLHTVCESASCPNIGECWNNGTLTTMIMGEKCTRACRFCDVPAGTPGPLNPDEPVSVAKMLGALNLRYTVITSVDRDDLPDEGAHHWALTLREVRKTCPGMKIEALIPDFHAREDLLKIVCEAEPDVLAHNVETVESLQKTIRPQASYETSLQTLKSAREKFGRITKSGLMLGLGEKREEIIQTMKDLRGMDCQILTLGQYLRPSRNHHPVMDYIHPDQFREYKEIGQNLGFPHVESNPLVRSSYRADRQAAELMRQKI